MTSNPLTRLRPMGARVVVRRRPLPDRTASGIYIIGREWPACGDVLAVGPRVPDVIAVGDLVYYNKFDTFKREVPNEPDTFILDLLSIYARIRG